LLIENLHLIQDAFAGLKSRHLVALASEMNIPMAEVFEVASFYHHFDLIEDSAITSQFTVRVCDGIACELAGSKNILQKLTSVLPSDIKVINAPCIGRCEQAPAAVVHQNPVAFATVEKVKKLITNKQINHPLSDTVGSGKTGIKPFCPTDFIGGSLPSVAEDGSLSPTVTNYETYVKNGGYTLPSNIDKGNFNKDHIVEIMENSGLRGLGGAGFPAGRKWKIVNSYPGPRLMAVNLDEGEPGTFKDRTYLERDPHRFLEGMLIAAKVVGVETCYIYLRDEYHGCREILEKEIKTLQLSPPCKLPKIELRRGAGAYICGEESAMIESIEGKRGEPRMRPPYIAEVGLFGKPTLEHNYETLYWVRDILEKGAEWFSNYGKNGRKGIRSFSVSGRVKNPGVKLAPAGITIQELIDEYCGGMNDGHEFYGYLPGGASGGILPASMNDIPLDFDTLQPYGCFIGSAAIVVFSKHDSVREVAINLMSFFEHESCGQCTPCRVGTEKAKGLMSCKSWDKDALDDLKTVMVDASICGLGQAAPNPITCVQKYFPHEVS
jgi:formate dehydrogenase